MRVAITTRNLLLALGVGLAQFGARGVGDASAVEGAVGRTNVHTIIGLAAVGHVAQLAAPVLLAVAVPVAGVARPMSTICETETILTVPYYVIGCL